MQARHLETSQINRRKPTSARKVQNRRKQFAGLLIGVTSSLGLAAIWSTGSALANKPGEEPIDSQTLATLPLPDDGTYLQMTVKSFKECSALCAADSQTCRGTMAEQPDVTKSVFICRLNNGFGKTPLFPSVAPEPLNLNIAAADLNDYRLAHHLRPVILNEKLVAASQIHAQDMARRGVISHTGSDGSDHGKRIQRQGYVFRFAAENVATGQKSWDKVFKAWQDSPGHNKNLLMPEVSEFGVALVYEPKTRYQTYWAMVLAKPYVGEPNSQQSKKPSH